MTDKMYSVDDEMGSELGTGLDFLAAVELVREYLSGDADAAGARILGTDGSVYDLTHSELA